MDHSKGRHMSETLFDPDFWKAQWGVIWSAPWVFLPALLIAFAVGWKWKGTNQDGRDSVKCSLQIDNSAVMFAFQLLHQLFELVLCSIDLLLNQARPFLQISTDITRRLSPHQLFFCSPPFGSDCISILRKCETIASRHFSQPRLSRPQKQKRNPNRNCLV